MNSDIVHIGGKMFRVSEIVKVEEGGNLIGSTCVGIWTYPRRKSRFFRFMQFSLDGPDILLEGWTVSEFNRALEKRGHEGKW